MRKVELSLQERRRGRKRPSLMVKKDGMILNKVMNDIVDIRKPLDILKNALLDRVALATTLMCWRNGSLIWISVCWLPKQI